MSVPPSKGAPTTKAPVPPAKAAPVAPAKTSAAKTPVASPRVAAAAPTPGIAGSPRTAAASTAAGGASPALAAAQRAASAAPPVSAPSAPTQAQARPAAAAQATKAPAAATAVAKVPPSKSVPSLLPTGAAPFKATASPRGAKFPSRPPPTPPKAPPSDMAVQTGRTLRGATRGQSPKRTAMPTLRPSKPLPRASMMMTSEAMAAAMAASAAGVACPSCGISGTDAFCAHCGASMADGEVPALADDLDALLKGSVLKVCKECYEEGFDAFCAACGGKMIELDLSDDELPPVASPTTLSRGSGAEGLARLEAALLQEQQAASSIAARPSAVAALKGAPHSASSPAIGAAASKSVAPPAVATAPQPTPLTSAKSAPAVTSAPPRSAALPPFVPAKKPERVLVVDVGSDTVKFGWNSDADAGRIRACVDTRANVNTADHFVIKGQVYPMDGSVAENDEERFSDRNLYLDDLMRKICKIGNYDHDEHAIALITAVPSHFDCVCEWVFRWGEGEVTGKRPRAIYLGYAPVLALMAATSSPSPTGLVVDVGATHTSIVPVYAGCKIDHAIQSQAMGGRLLADVLVSKAKGATRDEAATTTAVREGCYVALSFKEEMQANGVVPAAPAVGQPYRGWKVSNASAEKRVEVAGVSLGVERFAVPELLFNPGYHPKTENMVALTLFVKAAITYCPKALQAAMLANVYVSGEGARFPNFAERLRRELSASFPGSTVHVTQCAPNAAWQGAKLLSTTDTFLPLCTTATDMQRYSKLSHRFF